jgi:hypothetical protein
MIVTVRSRRPEAVWPHGAFFFFLLRIKMRKMGSPMQMKMATLAPVPIARKVLTIGVSLFVRSEMLLVNCLYHFVAVPFRIRRGPRAGANQRYREQLARMK